MSNPFAKNIVEFHILQSFPVTCLNRDDVGAPKSAIVGGVERARVSSQCWKRQVRLALHDLDVQLGMRTKKLAELLNAACVKRGASPEQAEQCATVLSGIFSDNTLLFITPAEVECLVDYAAEKEFGLTATLAKGEITAITKQLKKLKTAAQGLDIALFGRMVAQAPDLNVQAACSFSHAISTHKVSNEVDFFTALDDLQTDPGAAHMGSLEYNSATYYRYVSLDLGELWQALDEDTPAAVEAFVKALYMAVPSARQTTQSGACPWDYARILVRRGQRMQASFDKPVRAKDGYLAPSIVALNDFINRQEQLSGSLYGKQADFTFGEDLSFNVDSLCASLSEIMAQGGKA